MGLAYLSANYSGRLERPPGPGVFLAARASFALHRDVIIFDRLQIAVPTTPVESFSMIGQSIAQERSICGLSVCRCAHHTGGWIDR